MGDGQRLAGIEENPQFPQALEIVETLRQKGFQAVIAGGGVRDALLGLKAKDLDLATDALPDAIEAAFAKTLNVGKAFGTIVVVKQGHNFEVTTFRADGPYLDGRHPSRVSFTTIEEDALRRDFTVNALFYDPVDHRVIDLVGGREDLAKGLIRAVGDPRARFAEDRLRMLRAVRFVAQLGFELDTDCARAIREGHADLARVSIERIFSETKRLLESNYLVKGLHALLESRQEHVYWPELTGFDTDRILVFPKFINWENAFAAICHLQGIQDPEPRLRAWKTSRESVHKVRAQLAAIQIFANPQSRRADRARILGGDVYAEAVVLLQGLFDENRIQRWITQYLEIADDEGQLPKAFLKGEDLREIGVNPGREMGELLRKIFDAQLEGRVRSRPEALSELQKLRN